MILQTNIVITQKLLTTKKNIGKNYRSRVIRHVNSSKYTEQNISNKKKIREEKREKKM